MMFKIYATASQGSEEQLLHRVRENGWQLFVSMSITGLLFVLWGVLAQASTLYLALEFSDVQRVAAMAAIPLLILTIHFRSSMELLQLWWLSHQVRALRSRLGMERPVESADSKRLNERLRSLKREFGASSLAILKPIYHDHIAACARRYNDTRHQEKKAALRARYVTTQRELRAKLEAHINRHPLSIGLNKLERAIEDRKRTKLRLESQWATSYAQFSWWQKLNEIPPDFKELETVTRQLEALQRRITSKYQQDIEQLHSNKTRLQAQAEERLLLAYEATSEMLDARAKEGSDRYTTMEDAMNYGLWGSTMGLSVSMANDLYDAHAIYAVLRSVNYRYSDLTDTEIWWEALWMSPASLDGLRNLTKGAYFETLVADNTGSTLHEHFNHPDTDIVIDGMEAQLKATDSIDYVNSVDSSIAVITTSEVAARTDAVDSGISNADITETTADALGGSIIDVGEGLTTALGGLGILASMRGFNHTMAQIDDAVETGQAIDEGITIAVFGTAKGIVDASEAVYNVVTSKPVTFMGKLVLKPVMGIGRYIDRKLEASVDDQETRRE